MKRVLVAFAVLVVAGVIVAQDPGGKMVETKDGIVFKRYTPTARPAYERPDASAGTGGLVKMATPAPPSGPAVVNAAYVTFRGSVVKLEKGEAITILDARSGKERRVALLKGAVVPEGLKIGDAVALRVPLEEGSGARSADRVELQKTPAAALDSTSKFTSPSSAH